MICLLLYAGVPIGRVALDAGEPAAGPLEPFPAYERIAPVFRAAGDALWRSRFHAGRCPADAVGRAEFAAAQLSLATEAGTPFRVAVLDFWDSHAHGEPPLVLAYVRAQPAGVPAAPRPAPALGRDARRPAA